MFVRMPSERAASARRTSGGGGSSPGQTSTSSSAASRATRRRPAGGSRRRGGYSSTSRISRIERRAMSCASVKITSAPIRCRRQGLTAELGYPERLDERDHDQRQRQQLGQSRCVGQEGEHQQQDRRESSADQPKPRAPCSPRRQDAEPARKNWITTPARTSRRSRSGPSRACSSQISCANWLGSASQPAVDAASGAHHRRARDKRYPNDPSQTLRSASAPR